MLASSTLDASICLRCHLRSVLGQISVSRPATVSANGIRIRSRPRAAARRFQSTAAGDAPPLVSKPKQKQELQSCGPQQVQARSAPESAEASTLPREDNASTWDFIPDFHRLTDDNDNEHASRISREKSRPERPLLRSIFKENKKGLKYREAAEKLPIKSLNKDVEIIVLKDVLKDPAKAEERRRRAQARFRESDSDSASASADVVTAEQIQAYRKSKSADASEDEVKFWIEKDKPRPGETVLTKREYDAKSKRLKKSFNHEQLKLYLSRRLLDLSEAKRRQVCVDLDFQGLPNLSLPDLPPSTDAFHHALCSSWRPGITSLDKRIPVVSPLAIYEPKPKSTAKADKKPTASRVKQQVIDIILRECWGISFTEELEAQGELEMLLRPDQRQLLELKDSDHLRPIFASENLYQQSKLRFVEQTDNRRGAKSVLRVSGPRAQAEAIALELQQAFQKAISTHLPLGDLFASDDFPEHYVKSVLPRLFEDIMAWTPVRLTFDALRQSIDIVAFDEQPVEDAKRHLAALLPFPSRTVGACFTDLQAQDNFCTVGFHENRTIPFRFRYEDLVRRVVPVPRLSKPGALPVDEKLLRQRRLVGSFGMVLAGEHAPTPLWNTESQGPWRAILGYSLFPALDASLQSAVNPTNDRAYVGELHSRHAIDQRTFSPYFPSLFTVLSQIRPTSPLGARNDSGQNRLPRPDTMVTITLRPTPYGPLKVSAATLLPHIELQFDLVRHTSLHNRGHTAHSSLNFTHMHAVLQDRYIDFAMPQQPADVRIKTRRILTSRDAETDPLVKQYVDAVTSSFHPNSSSRDVRAPDRLTVKVPTFAIDEQGIQGRRSTRSARETLASLRGEAVAGEIEYEYLLADVEVRDSRKIDSNLLLGGDVSESYPLCIDVVDSNLSGRGIEISMLPRPQYTDSSLRRPDSPPTVLPMPAIFRPAMSNVVRHTYWGMLSHLYNDALALLNYIARAEGNDIGAYVKKSRQVFRKKQRPEEVETAVVRAKEDQPKPESVVEPASSSGKLAAEAAMHEA